MFSCLSGKTHPWPAVTHNEPRLCGKLIMPTVIVILLTRQQSEFPDLSLTQIPRLTGQPYASNITPAFQPTVCLKCSSVTSHNNEQTQPSRRWWAGGTPDILVVWGQWATLTGKYRPEKGQRCHIVSVCLCVLALLLLIGDRSRSKGVFQTLKIPFSLSKL